MARADLGTDIYEYYDSLEPAEADLWLTKLKEHSGLNDNNFDRIFLEGGDASKRVRNKIRDAYNKIGGGEGPEPVEDFTDSSEYADYKTGLAEGTDPYLKMARQGVEQQGQSSRASMEGAMAQAGVSGGQYQRAIGRINQQQGAGMQQAGLMAQGRGEQEAWKRFSYNNQREDQNMSNYYNQLAMQAQTNMNKWQMQQQQNQNTWNNALGVADVASKFVSFGI